MIKQDNGITLIELLVTIAIVAVIAAITAPMLGLFQSRAGVQQCATDLIQHMRVAKAMAIKENREYLIVFDAANQRYLIGFDGDADDDLTTLDSDTFGICMDTLIFDSDGDGILDRGDRLPEGDEFVNGVPSCVRVVNITDCGNNVEYGYTNPDGTTPPNSPNCTAAAPIPGDSSIILSNGINVVDFHTDGSVGAIGSIYFQQTTRGYSYCTRIHDTVGTMSVYKWDGDTDNPLPNECPNDNWTEMR